MVVGPALTMGIASLFMGIFAVVNVLGPNGSGNIMQAVPTLVMSLTMMTGMILWPILARRQERRRKAEREAKRQTKYRAYIDDMRTRIEAERRSQGDILTENVVTLDDCVRRVHGRDRSLWERTTGHGDFLGFRLGMGVGDFDAEIKHAPRKFTLDDDDLQDIMLALAEEPKALPNVPVAMSLLEEPVVGVIGARDQAVSLARGIVDAARGASWLRRAQARLRLRPVRGGRVGVHALAAARMERRSARCASWPPAPRTWRASRRCWSPSWRGARS